MSFSDPISNTARLTAAARARETLRPDRLFDDPFADALAGPEGFAFMERFAAVTRAPGATEPAENPYIAIRTRVYDDFLTATISGAPDIRQVVLVAAGLDTRAFRLAWPVGTRLFELDRADVLRAKQTVMDSFGATPRCDRRAIGVDLGARWAGALAAGGFDPARPSAWLIEGLFPYLDEPGAQGVRAQTSELAAPGSRLATDIVGKSFLESPWTRAYLQMMEREGAPWRFGTEEPEAFWAAAGWDATVQRPGEEGASFGRWPFPVLPREIIGPPNTFLVFASRR